MATPSGRRFKGCSRRLPASLAAECGVRVRAWLGLMLSIGAAWALALALLTDEVRAGGKGKGRDDTQRAFEQTQQPAQPARDDTQQASERSTSNPPGQRDDTQQASERSTSNPPGQRDDTQQASERSTSDPPGQRDDTPPRASDSSQRDGARDDGQKPTGQRARDAQTDQHDDGPPKTLLDLIRRMTTPGQTAPVGQIGHPAPVPQLASAEVLGVGLSSAALAKARTLGFTVSYATNVGLSAAPIALLTPPGGLDVVAADKLLRAELPGSQFGLNYTYRPYHYATGEKGENLARPHGIQQATVGGCNAVRCYGPAVIGWKPDLRACAKNVRIGIIDTSVDLDHPALKGRHIEVGNFLPKGATSAIDSHGTGVLAILAGSPTSGTPGLVPDARFFAADVFRKDENGEPLTDTLSLLKAVDWMRASRVDLVNMSLSGPNEELIHRAIVDMAARGIVFVAAAGNGGPAAPPSYPAAYAEVVAVTAVDKNLRAYIHANHGDYIDVAAPGVGIWTAVPGALEGYQSGTSFAAPHVTAILAVVQDQVQKKSKEGYLKALVIRGLGPAGRNPIYGRGLGLAPPACSFKKDPNGWVTSVVESSLPRTPAAYK